MMARRSCSAAVLLLLVAGVVSVAAAGQSSPTFADWLAKSAAGTKAKPSSAAPAYGGYEETELQEACLIEVANRNCEPSLFFDSLEFASNGYFDSGLGCCDAHKYGAKELVKEIPEIGTCSFTEFPLYTDVKVTKNVYKTGTFMVTCNLNEKSSDCGHPFCDRMVLSAQGDIFSIDNAVVSGLPEDPYLDESCDYPDNGGAKKRAVGARGKLRGGAKGKKTKAHGKILAKAAGGYSGDEDEDEGPHYYEENKPRYYEEENKPYYKEEPAYYEGPKLYRTPNAVVYYGPMVVNSREHATPYKQGWFEYTFNYQLANATLLTPSDYSASEEYVLDPFKYKLSFYKGKGY